MTSEYLLKLASNASKLFESSEAHEKRLLLKMALQNLELNGKIARYDWINPFDKIAFYASRQAWLENRTSHITTQEACIMCHSEAFMRRVVKAFSDFKLVAKIREEIEKVKPCLAV
ncbi:TPA: hypothetical protein DIS60_01010 [Patescibacteria group bacterium]|nr:hypothetical protein [Patescibacteria group bacterium]